MEDDNNNQQHRAAAEEEGKALEEDDNRITGGDGGAALMAAAVLPPDIVMVEVLTRLPLKSLMRFKCVSKLWCSTVSHPSFSKSRYNPASGLFIITYPPDNKNGGGDSSSSLRCFYATLPRPPPIGGEGEKVALVAEEEHHQFTTLPLCKYKCKFSGATQVINGLFCLFTDHHVWVCSITTGEIRKLALCPDQLLAEIACNYYFGFVATRNEFKLLKLCTRRLYNERRYNERDCAVLTLGKDKLWRTRLLKYSDDPRGPEIYLAGDSIYIDGTLYCWSGMDFCSGMLIAFSFQDESFQVIDRPPRTSTTLVDPSGLVLLQFRGHFAVAKEKWSVGLDRELEIWVLEQSTRWSYEWFYEVINIPHDFPHRGFSFLGNLPTGAMLLTSFATDHESPVPVYSYDHTKGKFEKFLIGKFPLFPCPAAASIPKDTNKLRVCYYEEDITPLKDLIPIFKRYKKKKKKGSRPPSPTYNDGFPFLLDPAFLSLLSRVLASFDK